MYLKILTAFTLGISTVTLNAESPMSCPVVTVGDVAKVFKDGGRMGEVLIKIDGKKFKARVNYAPGWDHKDQKFQCVKYIPWPTEPTTCYYHVYNKTDKDGSCDSGNNNANLIAYFWMNPMQNLK